MTLKKRMSRVLSKTSSNKPGSCSVSKKKSGSLLKECAEKIPLLLYDANMASTIVCTTSVEKIFWKPGKKRLNGEPDQSANTAVIEHLQRGNDNLKKHWITRRKLREIAWLYTDNYRKYVFESSVYRILKAQGLIQEPVFELLKLLMSLRIKPFGQINCGKPTLLILKSLYGAVITCQRYWTITAGSSFFGNFAVP